MPNLIDNYCDSIYESSIEILNFLKLDANTFMMIQKTKHLN